MHLSDKPINYSKTEEFIHDVNNLTLENARKLVRKLYEDNRHLETVAAKAAVTVDQYKHLLSVFDGYVAEKKNVSDKCYSLKRLLASTIAAAKHLAFWMMMLSEAAGHIYFEDDTVVQNLFKAAGDVSQSICAITANLKTQQILSSDEKNGITVQNLERNEENSENSMEGFYSSQSSLISGGDEKFPERVAKRRYKAGHHKRGKSTLDDRNVLQKDEAACHKEQSETSTKQSASTSENEINEGGESVRNQVTCERPEKRKEKIFSVSYLQSKNLLKTDVMKSRKIFPNISLKYNKGSCSTSLSQSVRDENYLNEGDQSSSTYEDDSTLPNTADTSSKGPYRYKRKLSLDTHESFVQKAEKNKRKTCSSQNTVPVTKRSRRYRRSNPGTPENYINMTGIDKSETITDQNSTGASKRLHKSSKHHFLKTEENETVENSPSTSSKKLKKRNSFLISENEAEDENFPEKPKKNRRGRKKKTNVKQADETKMFVDIDENMSIEEVPCSSNSNIVKKKLHVLLKNVLDEPEAQHYLDVIQCKERKENENADVAKCKENSEMEETIFSKERNEMEALQEWNVLDAVSDEEDKELDNTEGIEESSDNNADQQTSDSDVEQEQVVNDNDKEQLEIDDSEREIDYSGNVKLDRSCSSKHDDSKNYNSSDSELNEHKKEPSTPDVSPHESDSEDNSDAQDENDGDADSDRSNEDENTLPRSPASGSARYGKKGPRTPPSPPPEPLRWGPQTPPGSGPDSEVSGRPFDSFYKTE